MSWDIPFDLIFRGAYTPYYPWLFLLCGFALGILLKEKKMTQLAEFTRDGEAFERLLDDALDGAKYPAAKDFTHEMVEAWQQYGIHMQISEKQWNWLNKLAGNS